MKHLRVIMAVAAVLALRAGTGENLLARRTAGAWGGYTYTPLVVPGAQWSGLPQATGINNRGEIIINGNVPVGSANFPAGYLRHADGTYEPIMSPTFRYTKPYGINDLGQIVGEMVSGFDWGIFVREPDGTYRTVHNNHILFVEGFDINTAGEISGTARAEQPSCGLFALLIAPNGSRNFFKYPDGCESFQYGINDRGDTVGYALTVLQFHVPPIGYLRRADGQMLPISTVGLPSGAPTLPTDINNVGQILLKDRGVRQPNGVLTEVKFAGAAGTLLYGVNDRGVIVGGYGGGAFMAEPQGTLMLVPASAISAGGVHTVTATARDTMGLPVPGVKVYFVVNAGPNNGIMGSAVTNEGGEAVFNYTGNGDLGTDEIVATADSVVSNLAIKKWEIPDTTNPVCNITTVLAGPPKQIQLTVQDTGWGLNTIAAATNVNFNTNVPSFAQGSTAPVLVTSTKIDTTQSSTLALRVTDLAGNANDCPIYHDALRDAGNPNPVTFTVSQEQRYIHIANGSPGVRKITVYVNDRKFEDLSGFKDGEVRTLAVGPAFRPGRNVIALDANGGKQGGTADILISDRP